MKHTNNHHSATAGHEQQPNKELIGLLNLASADIRGGLPTGYKLDINYVFKLERAISKNTKVKYQSNIETIDIIEHYGTRFGTAIIDQFNGEWYAHGKNLLDIKVVFSRDGIRFEALPFLTVHRVLMEEPDKDLCSVFSAMGKMDASIFNKHGGSQKGEK